VVLAALLLSGFAQYGLWGGLGLVSVAVVCIAAVAVYAARARLYVSRERVAKRGFLRTRSVVISPGARLVRVAPPGPHGWGAGDDQAHIVLADAQDRPLLRWAGRWRASPEVIARAAGLELDDRRHREGDSASRGLLSFPARHPWIVGISLALVITAVVSVSIILVLRAQDAERDRDAVRMQTQLDAHVREQARSATAPALRAAWREIGRPGGLRVDRLSPGPYADTEDRDVTVFIDLEDALVPETAGVICRSVLVALPAPPLAISTVYVNAGEDRLACDRRGVYPGI